MTNKEMVRRGKLLLDGDEEFEQFSNFDRVFPMTTENINGYFDYYDMNGKDILTVCSSGDHIFEAMLRGATNIDCFDVNTFTEYYYYFKKALIQATSFKEFEEILIFNLVSNGSFKEAWYERLREYINYPYRQFWDEIMEYALSNNLPVNRLMFPIICYAKYYNRFLSYFNEENFAVLKQLLDNNSINFIHSDLMHLHRALDSTYDYIFLSNIADYVGVRKVADFSLEKLLPFVNEGGEIAYAYMYDVSMKSNHICFNDGILTVPSIVRQNRNNDLVLTLKKK